MLLAPPFVDPSGALCGGARRSFYKIGPCLHHDTPLIEKCRSPVGSANRIGVGVGERRFADLIAHPSLGCPRLE